MKIACLLGDGFEDSEFQKPYDAYREAGHDVRIIGVEAGTELKGKKGSVSTKGSVEERRRSIGKPDRKIEMIAAPSCDIEITVEP